MKLQLPKLPQMLKKRPAFLTRKPAKPKPMKLNAATARMRPGTEDDYDDEPQTRLSSAFFVVLILHVVAVGGIYAFNSIKAHRRGFEPAVASAKAAAVEKNEASETPAKSLTVPAAHTSAPVAPAPAAPAPTGRFYQVKSGDTLQRISAAMNVSIAELQFVNSAKDLANLKAGHTINLPAKKIAERPAALVEPPAPNPVAAKKTETSAKTATTYDVQKGDTATSIARRFGVTVDELLKLNKVTDPKKLQLGQTLKLPAKKN